MGELMARLLGPDSTSSSIATNNGFGPYEWSSRLVTVYSDAAGTVAADIATYTAGSGTAGAVISGSQVQLDRISRLPRFWFPASGADTLYVRVAGVTGVWTIVADIDARLDSSAPVVNVRSFGALGDNATDDTAAIQAAIDGSPQGAVVFFPHGTYLVSAPIRLLPYRRYVGDGWAKSNGAVIRQKSGANITNGAGVSGLLVPNAWYTNQTTCDGQLAIDNIAVDGNKTGNPSSTACGIVLMNFWSQVTRCYVVDAPLDGIRLTDVTINGTNVITNTASECDILDNKINNCDGSGIRQISANNNSLMDGNCRDNRISYVGKSAILFARAAGWTFDNNHAYGIPESGFDLGGCYSTRIVNNYIEDYGGQAANGTYYSGIGASLLNGRGTQISGNNVSGSELGASSVYRYIGINANSGQANAHAVVANNILDGPGTGTGTGIHVQHSSGGVAHIERLNNRISNITSPFYVASGDIVHGGSEIAVAAARKYKSGSTTPAANSQVTTALGVTNYNRDSTVFDMATADAIQVLVYGPYLAIAEINFEGGTTGWRGLSIQVNGTTVRETGFAATDARLVISEPLILNASDLVTLSTYTTGTPPAINGASSKDVGLTLVRLGA